MQVNKNKICKAISLSLIEFGYPDATQELIAEVYDAYNQGARSDALPHGIVGRFAERQLDEIIEALGQLPQT